MAYKQVVESFDFNVTKYMATRLRERTADVVAEELAGWYPKDSTPTLQVRGLTGSELAKIREAVELYSKMIPLTESTSVDPIVIAAMKGIQAVVTGASNRNTYEYIRQLNIIKHGCNKPKLKHDQIVRIGQDFPVLFGQLSWKILELTGLGRVSGK